MTQSKISIFLLIYMLKFKNKVPTCTCKSIVKPDVVLYEEGLDQETLNYSVSAIANCDMLIVAGTSLTVQPASSLINYYRGNKLVLINRDITPYDSFANLVINDSLGRTSFASISSNSKKNF